MMQARYKMDPDSWEMTPRIELQSRKEIESFQTARMTEALHYLAETSAFYQRHFRQYNVDISKICTLEDLVRIPCTTKDDLQRFNWDFLCVPRNRVAEYTSTSGTLGKPVTIALTRNDMSRLAYNEAISFVCADGTASDTYQLMLTLDRQFMAGIAYYEGIRKLGASLVRVGPGLPAMQWDAIERLKPNVLVAVPSFILKLVEYAKQNNIDLNGTAVQRAVCIGENLRTPDQALTIVGRRISEAWNIRMYSTYASTEMQTAFTECSHGVGGHHHPELIIVELLDDKDEPVKDGEPGEVTITTLGVEGMPLLRYKTGDIAVAYHGKCGCGRNTMRLGPVLGRKQQMIKLKGTTLYPPAIFDIINKVAILDDFVAEVYTNALGNDDLKLHILVREEDNRQLVKKELSSLFQSHIRVVPEIVFSSPAELERLQLGKTDRKIKRFVDSRE